jgi:hypothetical protein
LITRVISKKKKKEGRGARLSTYAMAMYGRHINQKEQKESLIKAP